MTQERDDYMRHQDAEHDMIAMRRPTPPPTPAAGEREAVARALYDHESPNSALAWEHKPAHFQENVRRYADAALSTLAQVRAAEILAAEVNERARIARFVRFIGVDADLVG